MKWILFSTNCMSFTQSLCTTKSQANMQKQTSSKKGGDTGLHKIKLPTNTSTPGLTCPQSTVLRHHRSVTSTGQLWRQIEQSSPVCCTVWSTLHPLWPGTPVCRDGSVFHQLSVCLPKNSCERHTGEGVGELVY